MYLNLSVWLDAVHTSTTKEHLQSKAFAKLVFLVTSSAMSMQKNSEIGEMIGLTGPEVGRLRSEGDRIFKSEKKLQKSS